jgi:hypothetical protein
MTEIRQVVMTERIGGSHKTHSKSSYAVTNNREENNRIPGFNLCLGLVLMSAVAIKLGQSIKRASPATQFVVCGYLIEQQLKTERPRMGAMAACRPCLPVIFHISKMFNR